MRCALGLLLLAAVGLNAAAYVSTPSPSANDLEQTLEDANALNASIDTTGAATTQTRELEAEYVVSRPTLYARGDANGLSFKILQLADLHYSGNHWYKCKDSAHVLIESKIPCTEGTTTEFVNTLLDTEKPDFVVFSGDEVQTSHHSKRQAAVNAFTQGVEERKIPYAVVFGNHDDEDGFSRDQILNMVMQKQYSYARRGPSTVDGVGNYEYSVHAPAKGAWGKRNTDVFRMYFLDSGALPDKKKFPDTTSPYDWIKQSQIDYYRQLSDAHKTGTHDRVPALMFFHIPLPEYNDATKDNRNGDEKETPTGPTVNTGLFSTLVELKEVKAVFVGHDHLNEFCYKRQGIQLCYGGGTGFGKAYGSPTIARRARVIEWGMNAQGHRTIRSWKRYFDEDRTFTEETLYRDSGLK